jgi:hypothetical protein
VIDPSCFFSSSRKTPIHQTGVLRKNKETLRCELGMVNPKVERPNVFVGASRDVHATDALKNTQQWIRQASLFADMRYGSKDAVCDAWG